MKRIALLGLLICGVAQHAFAAADTTDEFVTGVLAVPFKWHIADKSSTMGSTVGGYLGYQTKTYRDLTVTPIIGGGLALIDVGTAGGQNSIIGTGISVATGLIGRVGSTGTTGVQLGLIVGVDWLGRSAGYRYEGKPWLAFECGYNFSL